MLYFFQKAGKIAAALEETPFGLRRLGAMPPNPQIITLTQLRALLKFPWHCYNNDLLSYT